MSFILQDLADQDHDLQINAWNWRPTLVLISTFGILDDERLEMMGCNGTGVSITAEEAEAISKQLAERVLPNLRPGQRVLYDLSVTSTPKDGILHIENPEKNYSATYEWLVEFVEFCSRCQGFTVL